MRDTLVDISTSFEKGSVHTETSMPVKQCVCRNLNFDSLLKLARAESMSFEQLRQRTHCAEGCGMCEAYIRVMLRTGQTSFKPMNRLSISRVLNSATGTEPPLIVASSNFGTFNLGPK